MIHTECWSDFTDEPLTLENVKNLYDPSKVYRIHFDNWEPGSINGFWLITAGYTTYYIQQGTVMYISEETNEELSAGPGCIVKLPKGDYLCKVTSDIRLEFIKVLEWPDGFLRNP